MKSAGRCDAKVYAFSGIVSVASPRLTRGVDRAIATGIKTVCSARKLMPMPLISVSIECHRGNVSANHVLGLKVAKKSLDHRRGSEPSLRVTLVQCLSIEKAIREAGNEVQLVLRCKVKRSINPSRLGCVFLVLDAILDGSLDLHKYLSRRRMPSRGLHNCQVRFLASSRASRRTDETLRE